MLLGSAAALRAFGSAAAVGLASRVVPVTGVGWLAAALATGLATLALLGSAWWPGPQERLCRGQVGPATRRPRRSRPTA